MTTPFRQNYIIQIPLSVKEDTDLKWIHRIAYHFFCVYDGDGARVREELGLSASRTRAIIAKLHGGGAVGKHIERIVDEKGQIKYIPIDHKAIVWEKVRKLRDASKVGFKIIRDSDFLRWQVKHNLLHIYKIIEVLEWQYRKSGKKIDSPHKLVTAILNRGDDVGADKDFVTGFWEKSKQNRTEEKKPEPKNDVDIYFDGRAEIAKIRKQLEGNA